MDVAIPALLLVKIFIDGLSVLIDGDRLAAQSVRFLEIVFAA
jgi:hypothetical protein